VGVTNSWRQTVTMADWMRDIEKRLMHEERRPSVAPAFDVVGPGISTYSQQVEDWDSNGPIVNGFFYSDATKVVNSPDNAKNWIGIVQANPYGGGVQRVWEYMQSTWIDDDSDPTTPPIEQRDPLADPILYTRSFKTNTDGTRTYTAWVQGSGGGSGGGVDVYDEGFAATLDATVLNFVGAGVQALGAGGGAVEINIPGAAAQAYVHNQATPAVTWTIDHPLSFRPNITVVDSANAQVEGDVQYTSATQIVLTFTAAFSGIAYLS
jgi:hypothetical protein